MAFLNIVRPFQSEFLEEDLTSVLFTPNSPVTQESYSGLIFKDYWKTITAECYSVCGEFVMMMDTVDSRGFKVFTPYVLNYPLLHEAYRTLTPYGRHCFMRMPLRSMAYLESYFGKTLLFSAADTLSWIVTFDDLSVEGIKRELRTVEYCEIPGCPNLDEIIKRRHIDNVNSVISLQSGDVSAKQKSRLRRDLIQREAAYEKSEAIRKKTPKVKREAQIKKARKEAHAARQPDFDDISLEGGLGAVLKSIAMFPVDVYRTGKRFSEVISKVSRFMDTADSVSNDPVVRSAVIATGQKVVNAAVLAEERSSSIVEAVQGVARAHRSITEEIQEAIQKLTRTLSEDLPSLVVKTMMACLFVYLFTTFKAQAIRLTVLTLAGAYFAKDVYNLFAKAFRLGKQTISEEPIHQESGFDHSFLIQVLSLVMAGSIFAGGKPPGFGGLMVKIAAAIGSFPRLNKGIDTLIEMSMDMLEKVVNVVRSWMQKHPVRLFKKHSAIVEKLISEAVAFEYSMICGTHGLTDTGLFNKIMYYTNAFMEIRKAVSHDEKLKKEMDYYIVRFQRHSEPYKVSVSANGGYRPQPVTLVLAGDPGIGKTMCTQTLCLTLMKLTGQIGADVSVEEASRSVFVKPANSKYMDGYTNQFAYLIDDLFQVKPVPGVEGGEAEDIMTYHGSFNSSLNMADCPKKGMYPFTSKLILATTNCRNFSQVGLKKILLDTGAFQRRLDFHVIVQVKSEFRLPGSHMLDHAAFVREMGNGPNGINNYPWHVWECLPTTFNDGAITEFEPGQGHCMRSLITAVRDKILSNEASHLATMTMFRNIVQGSADEWVAQQSGVYMQSTLAEIFEEEVDSHETEISAEDELDTDTIDELHAAFDQDEYFLKFLRIRKATLEGVPAFEAELDRSEKVELQKTIYERAIITGSMVREHFSFNWENARKAIMYTVTTVVMVGCATQIIKGMYEWIRGFFYDTPVEVQSNAPKIRTVHSFKQDLIVHQNGDSEVVGLWYNVYKNTFKAFMDFGGGTFKTLGQVLVLKGTSFVMPLHFLRDIREALSQKLITGSSELIFRSCALQKFKMTFRVSDFLKLPWYLEEDKDLAFSKFGKVCPAKKDVTKFILPYSRIKDQGSKSVRLDTARSSHQGKLLEFSERVSYFSPNLEVSYNQSKYIGAFPNGTSHKDWLSYTAETQPGDCGAVLSVTDFSGLNNRFVVGLHVGRRGQSDQAYATQLDLETVEKALSVIGSDEVREVPIDDVEEQCGWGAIGASAEVLDSMPFNDGVSETFGSFIPVCTVTPGIVSPQKTSLELTQLGREVFFEEEIKEISGAVEVPELEVMKLSSFKDSDGKVVLPMAEALKPFAGDTRYVDPGRFRTAVFAAMHPLSTATMHSTARKFTFEEAVLGVPSLGFSSIPRSTSLGYPWCSKERNKAYFFGKGDTYDLERPEAQELKRQVLELETLLLEGKRPLFVCRDFLKDEVRKKGKGARLIAGTDVRYYILCRMYFGAFSAAAMATHQKTGICLGVNQYAEWSWLRKHVTKRGEKVWDGDFAGFDSSQQPQMLWEVLYYINSWYSDRKEGSDNNVRELLFMDLAHSRHLVSLKGAATGVVEWMKSLPSGHFLTSLVNTILCMACLSGAFIALTGLTDVWKYISIAAQGDDNLVGACDEVIPVFNQVTCSEFIQSEYGMVYTAGRKGEELKPYMDIEDVTFLQRRFSRKKGEDVCPIRPESFLHSLYYTKKNKEVHVQRADMVIGLERALEELSMHDEKHWRSTLPRIVEAMKMYGAVPMFDVSTSSKYLEAVLSRVPEYL